MNKHIVFTDLDGTLLDLDTYSHEYSASAVEQLQTEGIPVIFCSSKTESEQQALQKELGIVAPFIVENGSAIFIPKEYFKDINVPHEITDQYQVITLGLKASDILHTIEEYRSKFPFSYWGYRDLDLAEICKITGLSASSARKATNREFSETLIKGNFDALEFHHFKLAMELRGISCVHGSKFVTIMGKYANKGKAVKLLHQLYELNWGTKVTSIGIGDSGNDLPMLDAVDTAFLVKKPNGTWHPTNLPNITKVDEIGARGWSHIAEAYLLDALRANY